MRVVSRPVFRRMRVRREPELVDLTLERENERIGAAVRQSYGSLALYPEALANRYLTREMEATGLFSCYSLSEGESLASVGLYRVSREIWTRVVRLPWYYTVARPITEALRPLVALPVIPKRHGEIRYYAVFNHLCRGPAGVELWNEIIAHINNIALEEGATLLSGMFDPTDRFCTLFSRGALNTIDYNIGYRSLGAERDYNLRPFAPDVRDLD